MAERKYGIKKIRTAFKSNENDRKKEPTPRSDWQRPKFVQNFKAKENKIFSGFCISLADFVRSPDAIRLYSTRTTVVERIL